MWGGNASADSNRLCRSRADMSRLDVKSVQGSLTKEIGFYAERASIHNTPKPKVRAKTLTGYFQPIIISHKSQTSPDQCLWQHDWWVCRCECQEKWSPAPYLPYFSLWVRLGRGYGRGEGGLYGEKPQPLWWALPGDNEGHAAVLSESTDRRAGGPGWAAGRRLSTHAFIFPLYLYPESRTNRHIYIFTPCQRRDCLIPVQPSFMERNAKG